LIEKDSNVKLAHLICACLAICSASAAYAQYGLYGSPEVLQLSQRNAVGTYSAPTGYPGTATPATGQMPAQKSYQSPTPGYQPHQTTAPGQNQYAQPSSHQVPVQSYRRPARLDVARQLEPIPAPPAAPSVRRPVPNAAFPQSPANTRQMYSEGYDSARGPYDDMLNRYEQAACGDCGADCGCEGYCCEGYFRPWYASVSALLLSRSQGRRFWTSYVDGDVTEQLENSDFDLAWKWGGEVRFGRRFCRCCVPYAIEAAYWTTEDFSDHRYTTNPGGYVSTPLVVDPMTFGGAPAQNWFDGAKEHRLWRRNEFHNIEINLIREQLAWACESPWDIGWSAGIRYFRFEEQLVFGSLRRGYNWGESGGEAYFSDDVNNNLIGFQVGFDAAYNVYNNVRLFVTPKFGLYNNYMEQTFRAYTNNGLVGAGPYGSFPVESSRNAIAFLTQIDVGADWQFSRHWSSRAGYRVLAATGMALADEQFPQYMVDTPEIANIQHCSALVLHGAFIGVTYNF